MPDIRRESNLMPIFEYTENVHECAELQRWKVEESYDEKSGESIAALVYVQS